jgi:hypothetical protein
LAVYFLGAEKNADKSPEALQGPCSAALFFGGQGVPASEFYAWATEFRINEDEFWMEEIGR